MRIMWYTIKNASNELTDTIHNSYSNALSNAPFRLENKSRFHTKTYFYTLIFWIQTGFISIFRLRSRYKINGKQNAKCVFDDLITSSSSYRGP